MSKIEWKAGTMLYPLPAVMVSCGHNPESYNIITIAWTGIISSKPPTCYISVRKERHSHSILTETGDFVINLTNKDLVRETDWCGVKSGRDHNKFEEMKLNPAPALHIQSPIIAEAPMHLECKIVEIKPMGSHDMFIAEIIGVQVDEEFIDEETNTLNFSKVRALAYAHGFYHVLGDELGKFGFSVKRIGKKARHKKK